MLTIGQLEQALLALFPATDAESWDHTGLLVGDPNQEVAKVAIALDPTVSAIKQAAEAGANVLVTHHPAYLKSPDSFQPADSVAIVSGAGVWTAATSGVALMCFHTALDVSLEAQKVLPGMLALTQTGVLEPLSHDAKKGYGQICEVTKGTTLRHLAQRCVDVFGRRPRVWGELDAEVSTCVIGTGAGGNLCKPAIEQAIDCVICGELKYHDALDLSGAGVCFIELGHDVSELPLTRPLRDAVLSAGVQESHIVMLDQDSNWTTV